MLAAVPFLSRRLDAAELAAWLLLMQLPRVITLLESGVGSATIRNVAHLDLNRPVGPQVQAALHASFAFQVVVLASATAVLALLVVLGVPALFSVPDPAGEVFTSALLLIGISSIFALFSAPSVGFFAASRRNVLPALAFGSIRIVVAIAVVLGAARGILVMAFVFAVGQFGGAAANLKFLSVQSGVRLNRLAKSDASLRRTTAYRCLTVAVLSGASFLVTGLDSVVVGLLRFEDVAPYLVSASLVGVVAAGHSAIVQSFLPAFAAADEAGDRTALAGAVVNYTMRGNLALLLGYSALLVLRDPMLELWLGGDLAVRAEPVVLVLVAATAIRLTMSPFVAATVTTTEHRVVRYTPIVEGVVNLAVSIPLTWRFGAIGCAVGTLLGSVVGVVVHLGRNLRQVESFRLSAIDLLVPSGLVLPILVAAGYAAGTIETKMAGWTVVVPLASTAVLGWALFYRKRW